ncbi:MAG: hypothetical protein JWO44_1867 [Bacteroidetes bacterium]|nr:hypothetical protein [Bacteroidota bacterium]
MAPKAFKLSGFLKNTNKQPLASLRIEAWDKDMLLDDFVGEATSEKNGSFNITFTQKRFKELFFDNKPDLYFKIYSGNDLIHNTEKSVFWNIENDQDELEILIDINAGAGNTGSGKGSITFSGLVKHINGNAIAKMKVRLNERLLRGKNNLKETTTAADGSYSITMETLSSNTACIIEAVDDKGKTLVSSDVIFKPEENVKQDLVVNDDRYKGEAAFSLRKPSLKKYADQLSSGSDKKPLSIKDVFFVANQAGTKPKDTFHWLRANELEAETKIPAEAFYGMFRQGLSTHPQLLSAHSGKEMKEALQKAAKASLVSDEIAAKAGKMVEQWNDYIVAKALDEVPRKMDASLSQVLGVAIKDKAMQKKVLVAYLANEGGISDFWNGLHTVTGDKASAEKIQQALKIGVLSGNQPDMIEALMNGQYRSPNIFHELTAMDQQEWIGFVAELSKKKKRSVVPSFIKGADENERMAVYAGQMAKMLEQNFPTHSFFGKLEKQDAKKSAFAAKNDLAKFFKNNPSFDLKNTSTVSILTNGTFDLSEIGNEELLSTELQSAQRLLAYTSDFKAISTLKSDGLDAAHAIVSIPQTAFLNDYSLVFGSVEAASIVYKKAEKNYMRSATLWSNAHPNLSFGTAVTPSGTSSPVKHKASVSARSVVIADPELRTMFGTLDACECTHCSSVFSPSAYYVDILNFLYSRTPDVYNELIRRRPDLTALELSCENTNTPLPYVDLVNELLENFVLTHKSPAVTVDKSYQTTWQAKELAANPEHLNYDAYDELKNAVYPQVLPFNLPLEETRVYLEHLGVQKHNLMAVFYAGTKEEAFDDFSINMERLNISPEEGKILSLETTGDGSSSSGLWNFYGFDKSSGYKALTDPADSGKQISGGNWDDLLCGRVDVFLQQTALQYKEMLSLLLCESVNPVTGKDTAGKETRAINIVSIDGNNESCELNNLELTGVTSAHLEKIHCFLLLRRKLDWNIFDLDKAAVVFGLDFGTDTAKNKSNLDKISQVHYLSKHLSVPVENLLVAWDDINTRSYIDYFKESYPPVVSLYEQLFMNKAVSNPVDAAFEDPAALTGKMDDHTATIVAALQISDEDYNDLKATLANNDLGLANLSALYRNALLARKLKLTIGDFLSLKKLLGTGNDPFSSPASMYGFLLKTTAIKTSGFSIDQLNYILRHDYLEERGVAPVDTDISIFLTELRISLRAISELTADEQQSTIVQKFSEKLKISAGAAGLLLQTYVKGITNPTKAVVEDFRADDYEISGFLKTYTDSSDPADPKNYEPVFVRKNSSADPAYAACPDLFNDFMRLEKMASVINKLKLSDPELEYLLKNNATMKCTDLAILPVTAATCNFEEFETFINLIKARDILPLGSPAFFDILSHSVTSTDKTKWLDDLVARSNWDRTALEALIGKGTVTSASGILEASFPADFMNGNIILQLKECLATLAKIGLSTSLIGKAIAADVDSTVSGSIKNAAKAKYDEAEWLRLARPLRDNLREKQREALVAYVVSHSCFSPAESKFERWKNSDELYEYLLIDVEMKPVSMTSRTKQAISSVQLFIDRVLLNLEHPDSDPSEPALNLAGEQVGEWKEWRNIYRIWEANRKIFLYPENWLEPELRDDKSPFFKDLETQLKQNELTADNVEDAFHVYLEKLDEVSRLEVVGLYHQVEKDLPGEDNIDILHVFARTQASPNKYFHRTLENGEWTSWMKLEIDVDGNHMVPVIFNRKLCLFWLFFTQEAEESNSVNPSSSSINAPNSWLKIQAAWSEYRKNKWTPKRLSKSCLRSAKSNSKKTIEEYRAGLSLSTGIVEDQLYLSLLGSIGTDENLFVFNNTHDDPRIAIKPKGAASQNPLTHISIHNVTMNEQMILANSKQQPFEMYVEYDDIDGGIVQSTETRTIFGKTTESRFRLVTPPDEKGPYYSKFFYQDDKNTFYITHSTEKVVSFENPDYGLADWNSNIIQNWGGIISAVPFNDPGDPPPGLVDFGIDNYFRDFSGEGFSEDVFNAALLEEAAVISNGILASGAASLVAELQPAMRVAANLSVTSGGSSGLALLGQSGINQILTNGIILTKKYKDEDRYAFTTFYHGHVKTFIKELYKKGVEGLLNRQVQTQTDTINFTGTYGPVGLVTGDLPNSEIDFKYSGAYSQYNWELFFHVPMLIACRLKNDQRFEEARNWFHYIFNPTNSEGGDKERFWQFEPFHKEAGTTIETLDDLLRNETELALQVEKWMNDPFKPHVIARMRISAYMKNIVMKYIDNLIEWGDNLFRRDTIEAINEATNLYILASKILGERPQQVPPRAVHADETFDDIKDELDVFSNAMVQIETLLAPSSSASSGTSSGSADALGKMFYFGVPRNEFLVKYWDTVADRLFKIRHSMNFEGIVRTLPLFEPPIDPAMLVRAAAAGMDLSSILNDTNTALPHYRFSFMLQKANEYTNEVKALGSALLQALEKRDSEAFALLRSVHEQKVLNAGLMVREKQLDDAKEQVESIRKSKEITTLKQKYYSSRPYMNPHEKQQLDSVQTGMILSIAQGGLSTIGGVLAAIPNLKIGSPFSMGGTWGGDNLGAMMNATSTALGIYAAINNAQGSMAGTLGGFDRRKDDWKFQEDSASKELEQIELQILSGEIKLAIAEKEFSNHKIQIENSTEADGFMRSKFSNQQLYDWMIGQLSTVYFQSYQLAYDLAKKAEQCYQYELGEYGNTSFVQFGYWDSLKKGLLSAEKLQYDLHRMESSFFSGNKRELELTKHISLFLLAPQAILDLRKNGSCTFNVPEAVFDLDFQGHYFRRIKSVSLSIPCIAGPYTSINATLRLVKHTTRLNTSGAVYESADYSADSARFRHITTGTHSIATSNAQNDGGMFELSFRDERYLPFEGCGAVSEWQLELSSEADLRMFDYDTISDVIMTMQYTAKEDAGSFKTLATAYLSSIIKSTVAPTAVSGGIELKRLFSLKQEFSTEWNKFMSPSVAGTGQSLVITLKEEHFPFFTRDRIINVNKMELLAKGEKGETYKMLLAGKDEDGKPLSTAEVSLKDNIISDLKVGKINILSALTFTFKHTADIDPAEITDLFLVVNFRLSDTV